ncbi:B12-binding domain-containing radical SAM protein [Clostridium sp. Marseille-P299]|uniref:B12-binding domain-containing radical SAM protein n=1 Tax=Clostridium sp. Marseille-P299 TaxID=1805477 RepID=UPI00082C8739|nr:B12-binding domain-containing radical SAM protein [Clostridium sp. Marseille-P299]
MKILLTAINAKYIHSNPAIYSLKCYAKEFKEHIFLAEFTINNYSDDILQKIYKQKPDVLAFSCYIWNIGLIREIIREYRKLDKDVKIWVGGPEVSYDAKEFLDSMPQVDGVMIGEGEATFLDLTRHYVKNEGTLDDIRGIAYRDQNGKCVITKVREPLDFSRLPFIYDFLYEENQDLSTFENRIIYYETSRGCPFSCSYCLSSIDKRVRLRDIDLVKQELLLFLKHRVAQVKFIDRTFNCNKKHAMAIWEFIREHDNGVTNFHFEIAADILTDDEIELIATLRPGLIQLEIGVQSTNPETIIAIQRTMDLKKVARNVALVKKAHNVHQHLDLIAGLPFEDYNSFKKSFNDVYAMRPDQLQLGFLKVLKGSLMRDKSEEYGIAYKEIAPYEVLYTNWLPYDDVIRLKAVEEMVEVYYNSDQFTHTVRFLERYFSDAFTLFESLGVYYEKNGLFGMNHSRMKRYEILRSFIREERVMDEDYYEVFDQILVYDLYLREKLKARPAFACSTDSYKANLKEFMSNKEIRGQFGEMIHLEYFTIDVEALIQGSPLKKEDCYVVFDYSKKDPLTQAAMTKKLKGFF